MHSFLFHKLYNILRFKAFKLFYICKKHVINLSRKPHNIKIKYSVIIDLFIIKANFNALNTV